LVIEAYAVEHIELYVESLQSFYDRILQKHFLRSCADDDVRRHWLDELKDIKVMSSDVLGSRNVPREQLLREENHAPCDIDSRHVESGLCHAIHKQVP